MRRIALLLIFATLIAAVPANAAAMPENIRQASAPALSRPVILSQAESASPSSPSGIQAIAAGIYHTCALTSGGGVKCWGTNGFGNLGNGTNTDSNTPVDVSGLTSGVTAIAVGGYHTCALISGGVKCWGENRYGLLGDGTNVSRNTPVNVIGLTSGVRAIAAGFYYTCALTLGGGVKCWGSNDKGQLGDGTITDKSIPVDVIGLTSGVSAISASWSHTCALTLGGGGKCWGENEVGQLGDGTTTDRYTPVDVSGLVNDLSAISVGDHHTCALTISGGAKCWGWNGYGGLGDGTNTNSNMPVNVTGLTSGVSAISTGDYYTCALNSSGGAKCWGYNSGGLGNGMDTIRNIPVDVVGLGSGVSAIAAGYSHTCVLTSSGGIKCWGDNRHGGLGDGTNTDSNIPVDVVGLDSSYISGHVVDGSGNGIADVTVSDGAGHTVTTDSSGNYTLSGFGPGVYAITPSKAGYTFDPISRAINIVSGNMTGVDFAGTQVSYSISGRVVDGSGNGIAGVTVSDGAGHTVVTDSSGNYTLSGFGPRVYAITPSKAGYTFNPISRAINIVSGNLTGVNFTGMVDPTIGKTPIIFVPGWRGFPPQTSGCTDAQAYGPISQEQAESYFEGIIDVLKVDGGYSNDEISYARLVSNPCYTPPIARNALDLMLAINEVKKKTNKPKVILIAHSMGGLVSRAYIEGPNYRNDVEALFTLGSPHLGAGGDAAAYLLNGEAFGNLCRDSQPAVCEFTLGIKVFNQSYHVNNTVVYHAISGDAPWPSRSPLGMILDALIQGPDDGIVPTNSGLAASLDGYDRYQTDEVHINLFGSNTYFARKGQPSISYTDCIRKVLLNGQTRCGDSNGGGGPWVATSAEQDVPASLAQHSPFVYGAVLPGKTATQTLPLEGGPTLFASQWQTGTLAFTLVAPNGQIVDPAFAAANPSVVTYTVDAGAAAYYFPNAASGMWQLVLQAISVPSGGASFSTFAAFDSNVALAGGTDKLWYTSASAAVLTATLSGSPTSAAVFANILRADGVTDTLTLLPVGGGQYSGSYTVPEAPGYAEVRLVATGTLASSLPFERGTILAFQIAPKTFVLNNTYTDAPNPDPSLNYYQSVTVTVGVNAAASGKVGLSADLMDGNGAIVAHGMTIQDVAAGAVTPALRFDGADIFAAQRNGPYILTNVLLTDQTGVTLVTQQAQAVYSTAAYRYTEFASYSQLYLPLMMRN